MRSLSLLPVDVLVAARRAHRPIGPRRRPPRAERPREDDPGRVRGDAGQTTVEYALVLIAVAAVAGMFMIWATRTGRVNDLFDFVLDQVRGRVS